MELILVAHAFLRMVVLALGIGGLLFALMGGFRRISPGRGGRILVSSFVGLLDLQLVLGIVLLIPAEARTTRWPHALFMLVVLVLAHVMAKRIRTGPQNVWSLTGFFAGLLLLIGVGTFVLL